MRKIVLLTAILASFTINAIAQTYFPVTHTTGTTVVGGVSVTVTNTPGRTNPAPTPFCNAAPYYIGATQPGGYRHSFSPGVTHIRLSVTDIQSEDTMYLRVNGAIYPITAGMITDFVPCADLGGTANNIATSGTGQLMCTIGGGARRDAQIDFIATPGFIDDIEVLHDRVNTGANGVVYGLQFALDSCLQPFTVVVDSPRCRGRSIGMSATNFPNTTFTWTHNATSGSWAAPGGNTVSNPTYDNMPFTGTGWTFTCNATRGACAYTASKTFEVKQTPLTGVMTFEGPKCVGDEDTVTFPSGITAGGDTYIIKPNGTTVLCTLATTFNYITLPNIQTSDGGTYKGYAISTEGCVTDTGNVVVTLNPQAIASFIYNLKLGCEDDTVDFINQSTGTNWWRWSFGDGNSSTDENPTNIYANQQTYSVRLVTGNSGCSDSTDVLVPISHPLKADFSISDDSICQNGNIDFTNLSTFTPATIPTYVWDFKDGNTTNQFQPSHVFKNYGVYNVTLTITDYLGCTDDEVKTIVVDSLGSASFFSDTVICAGENIKFLGDYSDIGGTYAEWDFNDGHTIRDQFTIEHAYVRPGNYTVKLTANYRICPDTTYLQNIVVKPYPEIDLGYDTSLCFDGRPFMLRDAINASSTNPIKWKWNTDTKDTTSYVMVHSPGKYAVTVDQDGCVSTDTVEVKKNCYIDIPNVFTPDGDGYNDYFLPRQLLSKSLTKFSMSVFNRWGELVFETNSLNGRGWDGRVNDKEQPTGVYVYLIKASFANGYSENYQGNVTLIR